MQKVLFTLALVLTTSNANKVNFANSANLAGRMLRKTLTAPADNPASLVAEYHRRALSSDLDSIIDSEDGDDSSDHSHTLQFSDDEWSEAKLVSTESGSVNAKPDETSDDHEYDGECVVINECAYCSNFKNDTSEHCQATGRRERIECTFLSSGIRFFNGEVKQTKKIREMNYRSCRRTKKDEEFLVMQLQLICLLTSYFSLLSVRREKLKCVSLFDQRIVRRRPMIPVINNNPKTYADIQQVENVCCRDTNMEDNIMHKVVSSDGTEKLDNKF